MFGKASYEDQAQVMSHHAGGHAGYEIAPYIPTAVGMVALLIRGPKKAPPSVFNTVRHHDMHHRYPNKHFSLYFTHWDRWLGTLHQTYDMEVQQHFKKISKSATVDREAGRPRGASLKKKIDVIDK